MKKYFMLLAAAATVLAVSCAKEKNQPSADPTPNVVEEEDTTPQPILFGSNMGVVKAPITKGDGAIDKWDDITTGKLYIYGVVNTSTDITAPVYNLGAEGGIKINNKDADAPDVAHAGLDYRDPINVYESNTTPFYYDDNKKYDFYGYFVDDAVATPTPTVDNTNNTITLAGITIDGTQDIMWADTDKAADEAARADRTKYVALNQLYSDVSSRRGVKPNLNFQHQLSRFVFNVKAADAVVADGSGVNHTGKVTLKDIKINSKTTASLLIVGTPAENASRLTFGNDAADLEVRKAVNNFALTTNYQTYGESMVAPGETNYSFKIRFYQAGSSYVAGEGDNDKPYTRTLNIDFTEGIRNEASTVVSTKAEAGKKYVVNIVIYGLEEIKITVSLVEWEDADILDIDPDGGIDPENRDEHATLTLQATSTTVYVGESIEFASIASAADGSANAIVSDDLNALKAAAYFTSSDQAKLRVDPRTGKLTGVIVSNDATVSATASTEKYYATTTSPLAITVKAARTITALDGVPADQTLTVSGPSYVVPAITVKVANGAAIAPQPGLTYTFDPGTATGTTWTEGTRTIAPGATAGEATLTVSYAGDDNYRPVSKTIKFTVQAAAPAANPVEINCGPQNISIATNTTTPVGLANIVTFSAGYNNAGVTYAKKGDYAYATVTEGGEVSLTAGAVAGNTFQVTITAPANGSFTANTIDVTFTVTE